MSYRNVLDTSDPTILRVPLGLREEYFRKWETYRLAPSEASYLRARAVEERFTKAVSVAAKDERRDSKRSRARALSGSGKKKE